MASRTCVGFMIVGRWRRPTAHVFVYGDDLFQVTPVPFRFVLSRPVRSRHLSSGSRPRTHATRCKTALDHILGFFSRQLTGVNHGTHLTNYTFRSSLRCGRGRPLIWHANDTRQTFLCRTFAYHLKRFIARPVLAGFWPTPKASQTVIVWYTKPRDDFFYATLLYGTLPDNPIPHRTPTRPSQR
jgi:hypothetical protein